MDGKIMQTLISEIIESGEYTLEGIATYTKIPLDIIIDVTCGNNNQLSATSWVRIADLYMQVKSSVSKIFFEKLIETLKEYNSKITSLLNET